MAHQMAYQAEIQRQRQASRRASAQERRTMAGRSRRTVRRHLADAYRVS